MLVWAGWLLVSLFLNAGPETVRGRLTQWMHSAPATALNLTHQFRHGSENQNAPLNSSASERLERLQAENQTLSLLVAQLREENRQLQQSTSLAATNEDGAGPLVNFDLLPARILGQQGEAVSDGVELLVSLGRNQGIIPGKLALSGNGLLIDQGEQQHLRPDQLLTAGRALFGRVVKVGTQTSLVQPMTHADFRMAIRIVRRSSLGPIQGPRGILVGTGTGCRLEEVIATEAVAVGDEVFTDHLATPGAEPIYCGRVTHAEAPEGSHHWTINVAPVHLPSSFPSRVTVLRGKLNPERISADLQPNSL